MEKAKNVFAVLGLVWVIAILMNLIFPRATLALYTSSANVVFHLTGALHGNKDLQVWLFIFKVVPAAFWILLGLFAGIGVQSVIARVIRKARAAGA